MSNIKPHPFEITKTEKEKLTKTKGKVLWLTGLSGSGKSTLANELEKDLTAKGILCKIIDGDSLRFGLNKDLGFSLEDRTENIRRAAEVAKLFSDTGIFTICSFITPLETQRELIKSILGADLELIYINADIDTCEKRDPKGLYKKARNGEIKNFTGVDSVFEKPKDYSLEINTARYSLEESALRISTFVKNL